MTQPTTQDPLAAFVRARLAEDEQERDRVVRYFGGEIPSTIRAQADTQAKCLILDDHYHRKVAKGCSCELHDDLTIFWECDSCIHVGPTYEELGGWCLTVRALAAVYAAHPDYRQEWKP